MSIATRGRPPAPGSMRSRVLREMENYPKGAMPVDVSDAMGHHIITVRKAMQSLVEGGYAYSIAEPGRGGGKGRPHRYFHKMYPRPVEVRPVPNFQPQRDEVIVRFADLGPGRYLSRESWVDNYLGGAR